MRRRTFVKAGLIGGVVLAIAFNQWRAIEYSFYPYAVILQVTPIVAIAPRFTSSSAVG